MWKQFWFINSRQEPMMTSATPQSIIGSPGWWTISFLYTFKRNNDSFPSAGKKGVKKIWTYILFSVRVHLDWPYYLFLFLFVGSSATVVFFWMVSSQSLSNRINSLKIHWLIKKAYFLKWFWCNFIVLTNFLSS